MTITERAKMESLINKNETGEIDGALSIGAKPKQGYKTITDATGNIIDYQDVVIEGYASIYGVDRDGEEMLDGAFTDTLKTFMKNPVLCFNHDSHSKDAGVGVATAVYEVKKGLWLEGKISNAPGLRDLRFKVVEKIIRGLSVRGRFTMEFGKNFVKIHKVNLYETSLCVIPAQAKALFTVKTSDSSAPIKKTIGTGGEVITEIEIDGITHKLET
jgi:HK97 family phage prohead protease